MMLLFAVLAVIPLAAHASDTTCPDSSKCPANSTCCPLSSGAGFGCCEGIGGVCCKHDFCCNVGELCENHFKKCINTLYSSRNPLALTESSKEYFKDIPCSGSSTGSCPDGDTCCQGGCCPLPNAVCCSDGEHCCPQNTVCDVSAGLCIGSKAHLFKVKSAEGSKENFKDIPCSGSSTGSCPDGDTCCQGGCCPLPNAVCCSDGEHCCPQNTVCDVSAGLCIGSKGRVFNIKPRNTGKVLETEVLKRALAVGEKVVYCPGGQYYCPDYNTCCLLPTGQWGCCPYPSAVCCPDKVHCCPAGTHCSSTSTQCLSSTGGTISSSQKFLARLLGKH